MQCSPSPVSFSSNGWTISEYKNLWDFFTVGTPPSKPVHSHSYYQAEKEWKVFLNPKKDAFYTVFQRATIALAKNGFSLSGKMRNEEDESSLSALNDPLRAKIIYFIYNSSPEEVIDTLLAAFSPEEAYEFGCPQGERYSVEEGRYVTQNGPSFTRMLSPLIYYQQGGAKKSGRKAIVKAELRRYLEGYQTRLEAQARIKEKMSEFFQGENFYLYRNAQDPLSDRLLLAPIPYKASCFRDTITWISGGTSASFIDTFCIHLSDMPASIPKGILLQHNLPIQGRTVDAGIFHPGGVNWAALSGYDLKYEHWRHVFHYTKADNFSLKEERKIILSLRLQNLYPNKLKNRDFADAEHARFDSEKTGPLLEIGAVFSESKMACSAKGKTDSSTCLGIEALTRAKIAVLRIAYFDARDRQKLLSHLQDLLEKMPPSFQDKSWKRYLPLVGKIVPDQCFSEVVPGTIVAGSIKANEIRFGVVESGGIENISVNFGGKVGSTERDFWDVVPISRGQLEVFRKDFEGFPKDDSSNFASLIGEAVPAYFYRDDSRFQPGAVCGVVMRKARHGVVSRNGEYVYMVVIDVRPESITFMRSSGRVYTLDRPYFRQVIPISSHQLEEDLLKYPPMANTELLEQKIEERLKSTRQRIEDSIKILQTTIPLKLTSEEEAFMTHSFPIIFGSTKEPKEKWLNGEVLLSGCQLLGPDIPVVYTDESHIDQVKTYIAAHMPQGLHIEVLPFSELPS
jgi:hypothetical protein